MPDNVAPMVDDIPEPDREPDDTSGAQQEREAELQERNPGAHEEKVQKRAELPDAEEDEPRRQD